MAVTTGWDKLSCRAEFGKLSTNEKLVESALGLLQTWLETPLYESQKPSVAAHIGKAQYALLFDAFYQFVPFGTGGRRGRVGYGPNRINEATVALSVQGHCDYLQRTYPDASPSIVVAFDTRIFRDIANTYHFLPPSHPLLGLTSHELARQACEIYAGNGVVAYFPGTSYLSTPELSFLIRHLQALGGVNISASHNHPDDNGFKFFDRQGGQEIPPTDEYLMSFMNDVREVKRAPFDEAVERGLIRGLPSETHEAYIATNLKFRSKKKSKPFPIVYTPLCGTGDSTVGDVLRTAGFEVELYGPHANYDGTFAAIPSRLPNPEVPPAARPALEAADASQAPLVLSTDPDADRLGVYAKGEHGWRYISGNEIGTILAYYLVRDKKYGPQRTGLLIKTLVTTRALESIAREAECPIVSDLLVGFKYIAHVLNCLESEGRFRDVRARPDDLVLAAEESHGFLLTPSVRDKDAAGAALILCELASQLYHDKRTLPEYLDSLAVECGNYTNAARSIVLRGIKGAQTLAAMIGSLRNDPPAHFGDLEVTGVDDYLSTEKFGALRSDTETQSRNLLLYRLDGAQVVIRPSGTEPKAKIYVDVEGRKLVSKGDRRAAELMAQRVGQVVFDACIERIDVRLSPSAGLLPDYVDLDLKKDFDDKFRSDLLADAVGLAKRSREERLNWLRKKLSAYAGGADPIEAVSAAVAHLCLTLATEKSDAATSEALLVLRGDLEE